MLHLLSQDLLVRQLPDGQRRPLLPPPRSVIPEPMLELATTFPPEPPDPPTSWPPPATLEQLPHVPFVEPPQGIVVGMLPPGQPQVRYLVPAGRLQLPARAHPGHEEELAVQPHAQQRTWMVGWRCSLPAPPRPKPTNWPRTAPDGPAATTRASAATSSALGIGRSGICRT